MNMISPHARGLLRVRADAADPVALFNQINAAFTEFRAANDKNLADLRKDVVQAEKVDRINAEITTLQKELDAVNARIAAAQLGAPGGAQFDPDKVEHRKAFNGFFRRGAAAGLRDLEVKARLTTQNDSSGGYLVPDEMESGIDRELGDVSAVRRLSRVRQIGAPSFKKLASIGRAASGWVDEEEERTETATPSIAALDYQLMELYAKPAATQIMLDDADMDIEAWLAEEVSEAFAEQEGAAFVSGNGVKKPRGILSYDKVENTSYQWGKIGFVATGVAAALTDSTHNGADALLDLYAALKSGHRANATWLMSDMTMTAIRKLKDDNGVYLFGAPASAGDVPTILGKPVVTDDNMPGVAAGSFPIAFGDFKRGYLVLDKKGIRVVRNPFQDERYVYFYTTKRVGGGIQNYQAIKLLKVAAS